MTVSEIAGLASSIYGYPVTVSDAAAFINDALTELAYNLNNKSTYTIQAEGNTWYTLPQDFLKVDYVETETGAPYRHWRADGNQIMFYHAGTYVVHYYRMPRQVSAANDVPDCPAILHPAFAYYIVYRLEAKDAPADNETVAWLGEYQRRVAAALSQIQKRSRFVKALPWR